MAAYKVPLSTCSVVDAEISLYTYSLLPLALHCEWCTGTASQHACKLTNSRTAATNLAFKASRIQQCLLLSHISVAVAVEAHARHSSDGGLFCYLLRNDTRSVMDFTSQIQILAHACALKHTNRRHIFTCSLCCKTTFFHQSRISLSTDALSLSNLPQPKIQSPFVQTPSTFALIWLSQIRCIHESDIRCFTASTHAQRSETSRHFLIETRSYKRCRTVINCF